MRDYKYPIFFTDGTCVMCGKKSVRLINRFDKVVNDSSSIYPISYMKCTNCGREYYIMWDKEDNSEDFNIPIAVSNNYIDLFVDMLDVKINNNSQ